MAAVLVLLPDVRTDAGHEGLPPYSVMPPVRRDCWGEGPSSAEMPDVDLLHQEVQRLIDKGLTGLEIVTWLDMRIQPLRD